MAGLSSIVDAAATKYGVDPKLLTSVIKNEGGVTADGLANVSPKGAIGIMQFTPDTAKQYGVNPYDINSSVDGGAHYIHDLQNQFGGDNAQALIGYNWGPGNMDSFNRTGKGLTSDNIPAESLNYANKILTDIGDQNGLTSLKALAAKSPNYQASTTKKGGTGQPQPSIQNLKEHTVPTQDQSKIIRNKDLDGDSDILWQSPPDIHEPFFATAEIVVGDVVICPMAPIVDTGEQDTHQIDNEVSGTDIRLEEFQYHSTTQGGNRIMVRLFVKAWSDVVEMMALMADTEEVQIRFGYTNIPDGMTPQYKARILSVVPEFLENGYSMSIEAIDADAAISLKLGSKVAGWRAQSGRISDIAYQIAQDNNWKACIEPSEPLDPNHLWTQNNQSDLNFLNYVLGPAAKSDVSRDEVSGKVGPYVAYLHPDIRNSGSPILHFHPLKPSQKSDMARPQREYIWGGVVDPVTREFGTVLSFNPQFEPVAFGMLGASRMQGTSVDVDKKILNIVECAGSDVRDRGIGGDQGETTINMKSDVATRALTLHDHDAELALSKIAARYFKLRDYAFSASLSVMGDPYLRGGITVNVQTVRPMDGSVMFYDWFVVEVTHTISGGTYTCGMSLVRTTVGPHPKDSTLPGLGAGLGQYTQKSEMRKAMKPIAVGKRFSE